MNFCRYFNEKNLWNSENLSDFIKWWNKTNKQTNELAKFLRACVYTMRLNLCVCVCGFDLSPFLVCLELPCQSLWIWHHYCFWSVCVCVCVCIPRYSLNMRNWWTTTKTQQQQPLWADTFDIVIFMFSLKSKAYTNLEW